MTNLDKVRCAICNDWCRAAFVHDMGWITYNNHPICKSCADGLKPILLEAENIGDELLTPEELRRLRKSAGLTQDELAGLLDCTKQTISLWERGVVPILRRTDLAVRKALGVN